MILIKEKLNYIDVTDEWICNATPFSSEVLDRNYFEHNSIKYFVDGKNVVLDYSKNEKDVALWLSKTFGGKIYMLPRINKPDGIKTADYLWNDEYWDLKTPSPKGEFKNSLERFLKEKDVKKQAKNFVIDYKNFPNKTKEEIFKVVEKTLNNRNWVEKLIVIREKEIIKIYIKRK